ncbi:MAG: hypothetical protein PHV39_05115 [Methanomicrobium sp.]|nr:hypothetical protein [Methanomicrobium sp.]
MKIADIFEIDDFISIEPTMMDQTEDGYTRMAVSIEPDSGRLLVDENEEPIAACFHDENGWTVSSYLYRPFSFEILELLESCSGEIYQEKRDDYAGALREYYCSEIVREFPGVTEDNRPGRYEMIESLLKKVLGRKSGKTAIDFCCGSGVATNVLSDMGFETLSFDYDASLISCGIQHKRLDPQNTMCLDGADASVFCPPSDLGIGLMLGDITNFNAGMWEDIVFELFSLTKTSVISTATEREIEMIAGWCRDSGRKPEIIENDRDPIYDAWVCYSEE